MWCLSNIAKGFEGVAVSIISPSPHIFWPAVHVCWIGLSGSAARYSGAQLQRLPFDASLVVRMLAWGSRLTTAGVFHMCLIGAAGGPHRCMSTRVLASFSFGCFGRSSTGCDPQFGVQAEILGLRLRLDQGWCWQCPVH